VLAVFSNEEIDKLDPEQRRFLHALLAASWELDHPSRREGQVGE
jgi:hypothetical protein